MKKLLSLVLVLGLCGNLMVGCSNKKQEKETNEVVNLLNIEKESSDNLIEEIFNLKIYGNDYAEIDKHEKFMYIGGIKNAKIFSSDMYNRIIKVSFKDFEESSQDIDLSTYNYLKIIKDHAFISEMYKCTEDEDLSKEDFEYIHDLMFVYAHYGQEYFEDKHIEIQESIDEAYELNPNKINKLEEELDIQYKYD